MSKGGKITRTVALLAEGVDRNTPVFRLIVKCQVALLAEGVDRNAPLREILVDRIESPSSRRAWIEIGDATTSPSAGGVALLAEGVDRNVPVPFLGLTGSGRPPRGGRG